MNLSKENTLILLCSRISMDSAIISEIKNLLNQQLDWDLIFTNAHQEKTLPLIYFNLSKLSLLHYIPSSIAAELSRISKGITGNNIFMYQELGKLLKLFTRSHLDIIVLKGASYIETLYKNISLRSMGDIDLLVKEENLELARELLLNNGYIQESGWNEHQQVDTHHLAHFIHQLNKTVVELHWTIGMYEQILPINMEEVWSRAQLISIGKNKMKILSAEDMILHQCSHLFIVHEGEFSLKNLCDISEIIKKYNLILNWDLIVDCSFHYKIAAIVYAALFLVKNIYHQKIPQQVIDKLETMSSTKQKGWLNNFITNDFIAQSRLHIKNPISRFLWFNGIKNKAKYILITLFPSNDLLIKRYSLYKNTKLVYLYYFVRPIQLLNRHGKSTLKLIINLPMKAYHRFI